jgi:hypothetical protein
MQKKDFTLQIYRNKQNPGTLIMLPIGFLRFFASLSFIRSYVAAFRQVYTEVSDRIIGFIGGINRIDGLFRQQSAAQL